MGTLMLTKDYCGFTLFGCLDPPTLIDSPNPTLNKFDLIARNKNLFGALWQPFYQALSLH